MNPEKRRKIFERLRAANPNPTTELNYRTPFELLVAVVLSAQATDKSVNLATEKLFPRANTPRALLALGPEGLVEHIRTIGLYRSKARHLLETCRLLVARPNAVFRITLAVLRPTPGSASSASRDSGTFPPWRSTSRRQVSIRCIAFER